MKVIAVLFIAAILVLPAAAWAKGGFSSGGHGSFSSSSSSHSSGGRSLGSGSSSRSASGSSHVTITRNYYGGGSGYYYHPLSMYPGFGMGYGYSDGVIEGLILGRLLFPPGTTVYAHEGYTGNAVMLPDGRVADKDGYQVGTYVEGKFTPVGDGPRQLIAKPAPDTSDSSVGAWTAVGIFCIIMLIVGIIGVIAS